MTPSEIQLLAFFKRREEADRKFPFPKVTLEEFYFPNKYPCIFLPGYFYIPWCKSKIVVNEFGHCINLLKNKEHTKHYNKKGYEHCCLRTEHGSVSFPIHRIVASIFVEKPERHKNKSLEDLEVNHKDGDKTNNYFRNLEWVTTRENMLHAWETGLVGTEKAVLVKDVHTGEITKYKSVSECARNNVFSVHSLLKHLNSPYSGIIQVNYSVYKFDDGNDWPNENLIPYGSNKHGINFNCVAENIETRQRLLFNSVKDACLTFNFHLTSVRLHRGRKGVTVPYRGWIFYPLITNRYKKKQ